MRRNEEETLRAGTGRDFAYGLERDDSIRLEKGRAKKIRVREWRTITERDRVSGEYS